MRTVIFIFILHIPLDESTIPGYQKNSNFRFNIWIPGMFQHYPEFKKIGSKNLCPSDRLGEQRAHSGQASQRVLADWGAGQVSTSCPAWPSLLHWLPPKLAPVPVSRCLCLADNRILHQYSYSGSLFPSSSHFGGGGEGKQGWLQEAVLLGEVPLLN